MRKLSDVHVTQAIVHVVAPKRNELTLSQTQLPHDTDVFAFLAGHTEAGLGDPSAVAAHFMVTGDDRTPALVDSVLEDDAELVPASQAMAKHLNTVIEPDGRISGGALAVALCTGNDEGSTITFLSLLKLDPASAYRPITRKQSGKTVVTLQRQNDILPTTRERLQKAAFARPSAENLEYRLLALDRQTRDEPARFFIKDFLGAEDVFDATQRTKRLYQSLIRARNEVEPDLTSNQLAALEKVIDGTMAKTSVNVDEVIETLALPQPIKTRIDTVVSDALPDREFDLDTENALRFVTKKKFTADNNLRLTVPTAFYDQMVKVKDVPGTDPHLREVTIRTHKWEEH